MVGTGTARPTVCARRHSWAMSWPDRGALLVSGMAKGIDGEALKGALRAGGFTAAVLGGGADVVSGGQPPAV